MNENTQNCPICPRQCDLTAPHCGRGAEYAKTGKVPEGHDHTQEQEHSQEHRHEQHEHGPGHQHGHPHRIQFEKREQQLVMKYLHHAVGAADRGGLTQEHAAEMFSVLTEKETIQLANLLEKLSDHWMELASSKPHHHG